MANGSDATKVYLIATDIIFLISVFILYGLMEEIQPY